MVVSETIAGLGAIKTAFDMAKALENVHEAVARDRAVIDLQKEILAAQQAQFALVERIRELEKQLAAFKNWNAEKQRYELREVSTGVFAYMLKSGMEQGQPQHMLCANCYDQGERSSLQATRRVVSARRIHECPRCKSEYALGGSGPMSAGPVQI